MSRRRIWHVGRKGDRYRTAIRLWGGYRIHIFWRGDKDYAHHDHPNDFWTFPFRGYWEEKYEEKTGFTVIEYVKAWRWHFRPAEYRHRLLGRSRWDDSDMEDFFGDWFITLVKEGEERRKWGFWVWDWGKNNWQWIYWRNYLNE